MALSSKCSFIYRNTLSVLGELDGEEENEECWRERNRDAHSPSSEKLLEGRVRVKELCVFRWPARLLCIPYPQHGALTGILWPHSIVSLDPFIHGPGIISCGQLLGSDLNILQVFSSEALSSPRCSLPTIGSFFHQLISTLPGNTGDPHTLCLQRAFPEVPVITGVQGRECHLDAYCVQVTTGDAFQSFDIIEVNWRKCGAVLAQGGSQSGPHLGREHVYGTHLLLSSLASLGRSHIWIPLPL